MYLTAPRQIPNLSSIVKKSFLSTPPWRSIGEDTIKASADNTWRVVRVLCCGTLSLFSCVKSCATAVADRCVIALDDNFTILLACDKQVKTFPNFTSVHCLQYLEPGVVESLVDSDPLSGVQHQHAPHQILGTLRDVAPLARVHLQERKNTRNEQTLWSWLQIVILCCGAPWKDNFRNKGS